MGLVHDDQKVVREEVHQCQRGFPRLAKIQMSGIVLDPAAESRLAHHLDVEVGPLRDPLGLNELVPGLEELDLFAHLRLDVLTRPVDLLLGHHVVGSRPDHDVGQLSMDAARQLLHLADAVDLVAEPLDADQVVAALGRVHLDGVSPHAEIAAVQRKVVSRVLDRDQLLDHLVAVLLHAGTERDGHTLELVRAAQSVDAGYAGHHDNISALRQRGGRREPELIDLVVDHGVLGNIGIAGGNIGLRLIVIIIGDKVFHGVLGKELLHLSVELPGQCLVVGNDQRRPVQGLDDIGHGEGLTGAGDAQKGLKLVALPESVHQFPDGLGLVSRRFVFGMKNKMIHTQSPLVGSSRCV